MMDAKDSGREAVVRHRISAATVGLLVAAVISTACADQRESVARIAAPVAALFRPIDASASDANVSVQWNGVARSLVAAHNTNGPLASRVYALVSVAQFDAVRATRAEQDDDGDDQGGERGAVVDAAIARASANVLAGLYPDAASAAVIAAALDSDAGPARGDSIGAAVAQAVLARAATDGAQAANCPATPPTPAGEFWHDDAVPPNPQPVLPCFGSVRTWLGIDVTQFRAGPPPAFGSTAFLDGLAEVRQISDTRTAAQLAIVDRWLDGNNSQQPPGHWNLIASDLIAQHHIGAARAARLFAVLNIAMMDTHVACWDRKYTYWEIRPWMLDPLITTPRGQPHHPANPSGHACAGGAGSGVLAGFFPAIGDSLSGLGSEEGFSTVLSGVHFRFDVDEGLLIGHTIAERVLRVHDLGGLLDLSVRR